MARLLQTGFESGHHVPEGYTVLDTPAYTSGAARSGDLGFHVDAAAGVKRTIRQGFSQVDGVYYFMRYYVRFHALPASGKSVGIGTFFSSFTNNNAWGVDSAGHARVSKGAPTVAGTQLAVSTSTLSTNTWYRIEHRLLKPASGNNSYEVRIFVGDATGTPYITLSGSDSANWAATLVDVGSASGDWTGNLDIDVDDFILQDSSSGANNDWPGPSAILASRPKADISRASGWTDANAGTSALYDALDDAPPTGRALTVSTPAKDQIRNAASSATDDYVVELESLDELGVDIWSPILNSVLVAATGCDSATATNGSLEILSTAGHGAVAESTLAFQSGIAGTYPTNWKRNALATQVAPTVTDITVRPRVEIGKRTAATRAIGVSYLALNFEVGPSNPPPPIVYNDSGTASLALTASKTESRSAADSRTASLALSGSATEENFASGPPFGDFTDNFANDSNWDLWGGSAVTANKLVVPTTSDYSAGAESIGRYHLRESVLEFEIAEIPSNTDSEARIVIQYDADNEIGFDILAGNMTFALKTAGTDDDEDIAWDSDFKYVRLVDTGGSVVWETSPDYTTWTTQRTESTPAWASHISYIVVVAGYWDVPAGNFAIANLNRSPDTSVTYDDSGEATLALSGTATDNKAYTDSRTASLPLSASGTDNKTYTDSRTASLALSGSGSEEYDQIHNDSGTATLSLSGSGAESATHADARTANLALTGSTDEDHSADDAQTASLALHGTASDHRVYTDAATATLDLSGSATDELLTEYVDARTATLSLSASSTESRETTDQRTAQLILVGTAQETYGHIGEGTADLALSGSGYDNRLYTDSQDVLVPLSGSGIESFRRQFSGGESEAGDVIVSQIGDVVLSQAGDYIDSQN